MDLGLKDAAVLISGGTKGMGKACAIGFAREGARVAIGGRNPEAIEEALADIRDAGAPDAIGVKCDIGKPQEIAALFQQIESRWGVLHSLVNMAGPTDPEHYGGDFAATTDAGWDYFYHAGLMSIVHCCRHAVPLMRKAGWGRIVNISSQSARIGEPGQAPYMAIKAAVNALSKNMAWGLAKEGILVNSLTPGGVYSDLMRERMELSRAKERGFDPETLEGAAAWLADYVGPRSCGIIGRVARPEEIAPHVLLLGSRLNTFCTGSNVAVDGGSDYSTG